MKIFTTYDKVDIYKGDKYFTMRPECFKMDDEYIKKFPLVIQKRLRLYPDRILPKHRIAGPYINPKAHEQTGEILYFSTREAAENYINQNI